jgi:hypothetical protein
VADLGEMGGWHGISVDAEAGSLLSVSYGAAERPFSRNSQQKSRPF